MIYTPGSVYCQWDGAKLVHGECHSCKAYLNALTHNKALIDGFDGRKKGEPKKFTLHDLEGRQ